jgi:hypothetical protein
MIDIVYLASTLAFFALMLAYVALCESLGRSADATDTRGESAS